MQPMTTRVKAPTLWALLLARAGAPGVGVWAAVDADQMRRAPVVDPTRPLLREHELTMCEHFGIGEEVGRAAAVAEMAEGAITSIPPRS